MWRPLVLQTFHLPTVLSYKGICAFSDISMTVDLKANMPVDTDDAIHIIHRSLQSSHECTVAELGKNFYKNNAEFVKVAQEADKFENDLNTMRAMISQLKGFSAEITGTRDRFDQQAVVLNADTKEDKGSPASITETITKQPNTQASNEIDPELQGKLKKITYLIPEALRIVEGSRAVLLESTTMAVYLEKQWKPAQIWLLSNGVLIASRKAKVSLTQGVRHKLTFERFYGVEGLLISNVKDTADLQNCFKIKNSENGSVFLHTETDEVKTNMMEMIQKAIQDHQEGQERDTRVHFEAKDSNGGVAGILLSKTETSKSHRRTSSACTSGTNNRSSLYDSCFDHQELSPDAVNSFEKTLEDLSEALCCTNYQLALDITEKRNILIMIYFAHTCLVRYDFDKIDFNSQLVNSLRTRFSDLRHQLASYLFIEISDSLISKTKMIEHIQKLIVLGFTEESRERFLISRSELIKAKTLKIQYYGNVFASVALLSSITFESIEVAFDWFNESFMDEKLMSAFVSWCRNEISRFCEIFSRQALRRDLTMNVLSECIQDALNKCRALGQCGLDLSIFLEERFGETLKQSLRSRASIYLLRVDEALEKDSFDITIGFDRPDWPKDLFPPNESFKATEASVQLVQSIETYLKEVMPLMKTPQLAGFCVAAVYDFVDSFSDKFLHSFYQPGRSNTQLCHIAANVEIISRVLLPNLVEKFPSNDSSLKDLTNRLVSTSEALYAVLAESVAKSLVPTDFSAYSQIPNTIDSSLSAWTENSIPVLARLSRDVSDTHRIQLIDLCVFKILSIFKSALHSNLIKFPNAASLHKFNLDLNFILHFTTQLVTAETKVLKDELIYMATKSVSNDLDRPLPSNAQIQNEIDSLEKAFSEFVIDFNKK